MKLTNFAEKKKEKKEEPKRLKKKKNEEKKLKRKKRRSANENTKKKNQKKNQKEGRDQEKKDRNQEGETKEVLRVEEMTEREVPREDAMIAKDLHRGADRHHRQDRLGHFARCMPTLNMVKVEVHHVREVDHLIDIHPDPNDHTRNQVQAEDQKHLRRNGQEKLRILANLVIELFHRQVIYIR